MKRTPHGENQDRERPERLHPGSSRLARPARDARPAVEARPAVDVRSSREPRPSREPRASRDARPSRDDARSARLSRDESRRPSSGSTRAARDEQAGARRTPAGEWREAAPRMSAPDGSRGEYRGSRAGTALLDAEPIEDTAYRTDGLRRPSGPGTGDPRRAPKSPNRPQKQVKSVRGRRQRALRNAPGKPNNRIKIVLIVLITMLAGATAKLTFIQGFNADSYATKAVDQYTRDRILPADRGTITDRNGTDLAFSIEGRAIAGRPALFINDTERQQVIDVLVAALGSAVDPTDLKTKLLSGDGYVYLARGLMPAQADAIMAQIAPILATAKKQLPDTYIDAVVTEPQQLRQYPDGGLYKPVVGDTSAWDGNGTMGIENRFNSLLAGTPGSRTVDAYSGGVIPGSVRDETTAVNGSDLTLTVDSDLQYTVSQMLQTYVDQVGAKRGMAVVEDVKTGQVYSLNTYQPGVADGAQSNIAVSSAFEPGSVNKVVTFAAALEAGLITPTTSWMVNDSIQLGGRTIHDAWTHAPIEMTATGVLAKSSNVGTLEIAQKLGADAFDAELKKFGIGTETGIELAGESPGLLLDQSQWSSTTFANLPIGQGLAVTLVQLASMYQAIGNNGVKLPPTLVMGTTTDGTYTPAPQATGTSVMKEATADTLLGMLRGTTQDGDIGHKGTAAGAAINGYQVAGKTGTAQQIDPGTNNYSQTLYTSTFAGLVPADNPRFVVAIMLDAPQGGKNAVPLFHDIAAYAMRAFDVPPSSEPAPVYDLYLNY